MEIGQRIRERRKELGLSLRELGDRTDLTASFLSQLERDLTSPSIESLHRISLALGVPIFYFLKQPSPKEAVVRRGKRVKLTLPNSNLVYELLSPDLNHKLEALLAEHEPGHEIVTIPVRQETEEFIYVLQGQLEIQLGDETHFLEPGDSVTFNGSSLKRQVAHGTETLRFISVITPPIF